MSAVPSSSSAAAAAEAGEKRVASPLPSNTDTPKNKRPNQRKSERKPRLVRKANTDETVLQAIELLLKNVWQGQSTEQTPQSFGWQADDKQGEAQFCRSPPVPAKLASDLDVDCELDAYVHGLSERGVGIATRETMSELQKLVAQGNRPWAFAVPFTLRGEKVRLKSVRHEWGYTQSDLILVKEQSPLRVDAPCQYFGQCSGCQLQHVGYEEQLKLKREIVERAFALANPLFASLPVSPVWKSPLPLGYRTKLTPHFDIRKGIPAEEVAIGFNLPGQRRVQDIEDCIIGTDAVRRGLVKARSDTKAKMSSYKRGATLLVRETNVVSDEDKQSGKDLADVPASQLAKDFELDFKGWITDVVGDLKFRYPASSFFQNNTSILPAFTGYVRDELKKQGKELTHLIDAYCGSGLFGIACHGGFEKVLGIEISNESISCANNNARMNSIDNCDFLLGDASKIFDKVESNPRTTAVIIDPPRKGSNTEFLDQLIAYGPQMIVYIACGVPAQARDLNYIHSKGAIRANGDGEKETENAPAAFYKITSIQPFDLFPQTSHVENIVTLVRAD